MKRKFTKLMAALALLVFTMPSLVAWGQTTLLTEDFSAITTGNSTSTSGSSTAWNGNDNFPTVSTAYQAGGAVRLGSGSKAGSITSKSLTVDAGTLTVAFDVKGWSSVEGNIKVTAGSQNQTVTYTATMSGNFESKTVTFTISDAGSLTVKLETTAKRAFLDNVVITNTVSSTPTVATPNINPDGGSFLESQEVSILCATNDATIYYTLDGSTPTITSTQYTAPFTINATTTVKAFAVKADYNPSEVATAVFSKITPMSVAEALAATPQDGVYVSGIISDITEVSISYKNATYKISDDGTHSGEMIVFRGRYLNNTDFTSTDQIQVGDQVVVTGNLSDYQGTNQLAQGNYLVSLTRPATIVIPAEALALPCTANDNGSFAVSYTNNFVAADAEANLYTDAACNEAFQDDWIILDDMSTPYDAIPYVLEANPTTTSRTVYMKVTAMDSESNILEKVFTITQAGQPTYTVTYVPNGGSGTMNDPDSPYIAGDIVELLTNTFTAPEGMVWDSWAVTDAENNEVTVEGGMFEMPASNVTVTAQWVADPNATQYEWVLTNIEDLADDDIFVIVGDNGSTYAMANDGGTGKPAAVSVTIANNKLSNAPDDRLKWNISSNNGNYTFYPNGSTTTWLYCNDANDGLKVGTGDNKAFAYEEVTTTNKEGHYLTITPSSDKRYVCIYNSQDWRSYKSTGIVKTNTTFYKRQVASTDPAVYTSVSAINLAFDETEESFTYSLENAASEYTMNVTVNSAAQSWLSATINTTTSTVTITANVNDGAQREGIVTVNYLEGGNIEAYEQVTVTQAEFVIDYAALPFDFVGNEDPKPTGVTTTAGTYAASPYLKFDATNKYLTLKLNEAPLSLSYDIKVNGTYGTESVFDVLTSADGQAWASLVSYTTLSTDVQTVTHLDLPSTVRYIKWIYTNKHSGNVALGNIHASAEYDIYGNVTVENLTIPATKTCTVYDGAILNVTTSLTNEATQNAWNNLVIKDGAQLYTPNSVNGTVEKFVAGYGTSTNGNYILLATPATMDACNETNMWTSGQDADVDFYYFDQAGDTEGNEWMNFKHGNTTFAGPYCMQQGQGFLYANKNDVTLTLQTRGFVAPGVDYQAYPFVATNAPMNVGVSYTANKPFSGFNLIGNPFTCTAYLADGRTFYRMNSDGNGILAATTTENGIDVCEGIFVVTTSSETQVTFTTTEPTEVTEGVVLNLSKATRGASTIDRAIVRFGESDQLPKFQLNPNNTKIYVTEGNQDFAVVRSAAEAEMPVSFKASENGTYTLAIETENVEMNYLHLIDNMTGMDVDLLQTPSYTFEAKTSDYASRFRLVFKANNANEENAETFAYFNGSNWTVSNLGEATLQVVDVTGRTVSSETINGNATISLNQTPGVYMLRLVNGNSVKVQKVVVR